MPEMTTFGERLARLRKDKNLTQEELAERVRVVKDQVSRWETGKVSPEVRFVVPLADALGVSTDQLLRDPGDLPAGLGDVVARAEELFGRMLDDATIAWARDEVRWHGDVAPLEWVLRINRKLRGATPTEAQKSETEAFAARAESLGVRRRKR